MGEDDVVDAALDPILLQDLVRSLHKVIRQPLKSL
jgi:hypothetical protein